MKKEVVVNMTTEQITAEEALLWLAEQLPDLREPCPHILITRCVCKPENQCPADGKHHCRLCHGESWVPKQGETALYQAMHDAGWNILFTWLVDDPLPIIQFGRKGSTGTAARNPSIAAFKAVKQAGY